MKEKEQFLARCCCVDLEINEHGTIFQIGALFDSRELRIVQCDKSPKYSLDALDDFAQEADFLLGHNLLDHDLPILAQQRPELKLLAKPVVDTLFLSPLAFPANPYHRLVKNYKLVRDALNDPVADSRLARTLLGEQWDAFVQFQATSPDLTAFLRYCFAAIPQLAGCATLLAKLGAESLTTKQARAAGERLLKTSCCTTALHDKLGDWLSSPETIPPLAYCVAWLQMANSNSVLPPWVRHRFSQVSSILTRLRSRPCESETCTYCPTAHNAKWQLQNYFGFDNFRPQPCDEEGKSLQESLVRWGMADQSLLGILPTGGGKSLCYQLPALVRYQKRGMLTIIISPLQALMKDQVDNLRNRTGFHGIAALNGMLTSPERGRVLRDVVLGDIAILYISPEQLRGHSFKQAIEQREIGCWVFDEAHCLSKWGHDFRPDYIYAARFIKEFTLENKLVTAPVQCFTATAKMEVKKEIIDFFHTELDVSLQLFEGGMERDNLRFAIHNVSKHEKIEHINKLLTQYLSGEPKGAAIIYCATKKSTEYVAEALGDYGWKSSAFHGGMEASVKQHTLDNFLNGTVEVICATNAFGMGVDKEDVRLVVHHHIPGSLENYLQEAGRAGRDQLEAECILLYDENDIEKQFQLNAFSEVKQHDIKQILRSLRKARCNKDGEIILTPAELLNAGRADISFDPDDPMAATKVITAIAWLERAGFLVRNQNRTSFFQGRPMVANMEEAREKLQKLNLSQRQQQRWLIILAALMDGGENKQYSADELAELLPIEDQQSSATSNDTPGRQVLRTLHDMAQEQLIQHTLLLSAYVRYKVKNGSLLFLNKLIDLEGAMIKALRDQSPDADNGEWQHLSMRRLNQSLLDQGYKISTPDHLCNLLLAIARDGRGVVGKEGSIEFRSTGFDRYKVRLKRSWNALQETAELRILVASAILKIIFGQIPSDARPSAQLLIEFSFEELLKGLQSDVSLSGRVNDPLAVIDRALMYLHEQKVIILQNGLAIFRQAMTIKLLPDSKRTRRYTKGDYEPLRRHYDEKTLQIHVMNEYAKQGLVKMTKALRMTAGYFSMERNDFLKRFFPKQKKMLSRAATPKSFQRITESLHNPRQSAIVCASVKKNMLILAGPGSGKTKVVVHRCAYLLQILRIPASSILMLCFNRSSALTLRKRLRDLTGQPCTGVAIHTYHGLALRLTGRSLAGTTPTSGEAREFDQILNQAVELLSGSSPLVGMEHDEVREKFLGSLRYILVDEYQDIDNRQYDLISALTGRLLKDSEQKISIMAVGDDDQNIYSFHGSSVRFIREFQQDYQAELHYLVENYRSSQHIIETANQLISPCGERMKDDHPIIINKTRQEQPAGGRWERLDPAVKGRVRLIKVDDDACQAAMIIWYLLEIERRDPDFQWEDCAVLAREWKMLNPLRALCEKIKIPCSGPLDPGVSPPPHRIREFALFLAELAKDRNRVVDGEELLAMLDGLQNGQPSPWWERLRVLLLHWHAESNNARTRVGEPLDFLYELLHEERCIPTAPGHLYTGTAHSTKGLEFKHILLMDGGWERARQSGNEDEERRLYYVAITRARETLTLFQRLDCDNPYLADISPELVLVSQPEPHRKLRKAARNKTYIRLGPADIFLSYAGYKAAHHPIHEALANLQTGDTLEMRPHNNELFLYSGTMAVARLSRKAASDMQPRLTNIDRISITAILWRYAIDSEPEYRDRHQVAQWEIPLVEIVCK